MVDERGALMIVRQQMSDLVDEIENDFSVEGLEAVLTLMVNLAKNPARPGAWVDRTTALRNSISFVIVKARQSLSTSYQTASGYESVRVKNNTKNLIGLIYAGMFYGAYLEFTPGYSVLGYAVESFKKKATPVLLEHLKFKRAFK